MYPRPCSGIAKGRGTLNECMIQSSHRFGLAASLINLSESSLQMGCEGSPSVTKRSEVERSEVKDRSPSTGSVDSSPPTGSVDTTHRFSGVQPTHRRQSKPADLIEWTQEVAQTPLRLCPRPRSGGVLGTSPQRCLGRSPSGVWARTPAPAGLLPDPPPPPGYAMVMLSALAEESGG